MRRTRIAVLVVLACAGCGGGHSSKSTPSTLTVRGSIAVEQDYSGSGDLGAPCSADSNYADIAPGTQVVIADGSGRTLGIGQLGAGHLVGTASEARFQYQCAFPFAVPGVSSSHAFYKVSMGRRGSQQYTAAQIRKPLRLTLD